MYPNFLVVGKKTYYNRDGKIFSVQGDSLGSVVTHTYLTMANESMLYNLWAQLHDIYSEGRKSKADEIMQALKGN